MQKRLFFWVFLIIATVLQPAYAEENSKELCKQYSSLAESIMLGRQEGVAMSEMMKVIPPNAYLHALIVFAYDQPQWPSWDKRAEAALQFTTDVYLACLKEFGS